MAATILSVEVKSSFILVSRRSSASKKNTKWRQAAALQFTPNQNTSPLLPVVSQAIDFPDAVGLSLIDLRSV